MKKKLLHDYLIKCKKEKKIVINLRLKVLKATIHNSEQKSFSESRIINTSIDQQRKKK